MKPPVRTDVRTVAVRTAAEVSLHRALVRSRRIASHQMWIKNLQGPSLLRPLNPVSTKARHKDR